MYNPVMMGMAWDGEKARTEKEQQKITIHSQREGVAEPADRRWGQRFGQS